MIDPTQDSRLTPVSDWTRKDEYTPVKLPSGRTVGMRTVDVFSLMDIDGKIPQFLKTQMEAGAKQKTPATGKPEVKPEVKTSAGDMLDMVKIAERVIRAAMVFPPIVETLEEQEAGKGVLMSTIPFPDKMALMTWAIGGVTGVQNANRFPEPETPDVHHLVE